MWVQKQLTIKPKTRGFHLIDDEILPQILELTAISIGLLHLFLQHSSASLTINENADPSVRTDMEEYFQRSVPDSSEYFEHNYEGADDMPAHVKSVMIGCELSVPINRGRLAMGAWQGIYLGEHRIHGGARTIIATVHGQS